MKALWHSKLRTERTTMSLQVPATCGCSNAVGTGSQQKPERSHRIVRHHSSIRPLTNRRTHRSHSSAGIVQPGRGFLLRRALYGTREASKLGAKTFSKALSSEGWTQSKVFPATLYHANQVATSTCHGDDFFVKASLDGLGTVEKTPRSHC